MQRQPRIIEVGLVTALGTLSVLLCYFVSVETHATRRTLVTVATLLFLMSLAFVSSVAAIRRGSDRRLRLGLRHASVSLRSIEAVTDPALSFLPLDDLLEAVLARTKDAVGGDVAAILLVDEERQVLRVRASHGASHIAPVGTEVALGSGLIGTAAQWGRPVVVPNVRGRGLGPMAASFGKVESFMAAPLLVKGSVIGIVEVGTTEYHGFDRNHLRLLQVVADRCAASIERAHLDEAERRSRLGADHAHLHLRILAGGGTVLAKALESYDEALAELGTVVVPEFADWFAADVLDDSGEISRVSATWRRGSVFEQGSGTAVAHRHPRGDHLVRLAIAERRPQVLMYTNRLGPADIAAAVHTPESLGERTSDVESMLVVPVRVRGVFSGALSFVTGPGRRGYRPSDLETARELADRVGVAIERVASWRASQLAGDAALRYAERLQKLVEAALVVNAQLAEEEVLELLGEHAQRVLGAELVAISTPEGRYPLIEKLWPVPDPGAEPLETGSQDVVMAVAAATEAVARSGAPCRRPDDTDADPLATGPDTVVSSTPPRRAPSLLTGWLAVPLTGPEGDSRRVVVALGAPNGRFSAEDESVLTLLAQMASVALQNAQLYADVWSNEHRLQAVVDSSPLAIAELDLTGAARWWNRAAGAMFGWHDTAAEHRVTAVTGSELVMAGLWDRARNGLPSVGISVAVEGPEDEPLELSVSTSPLSEQGRLTGLLLVADDVTERRRILDRFHQAERLGAMNRMAGAVAHDFNNLLTVILGCAEVLMRRLGDDDELGSDVSAIQRAGVRAAALTSQLVSIGKYRPSQIEAVEVDELVASMSPMLSGVLGEGTELEVIGRAGGARILVDRSELERSLLNLAINASDAMPTGGRLVIRTSRIGGRNGSPKAVQITVSDTGAGMDAETAAQCFEPFFTTKGRAQGTGLGLAVVHAMATQAGGEVRVETAVGRGSRFTMWFPLHEAATRPRVLAPVPLGDALHNDASDPRGQTVLFVDDEPELLRLSVRELETAGYTVVSASGGSQALNVLNARAGQVDVVVTDVVMPGMNGVELAEAMARRYPHIPVLFVSGHLDEHAPGRRPLPDDADLLAKPFTPEQLANRVRRAIGRRPVATEPVVQPPKRVRNSGTKGRRPPRALPAGTSPDERSA